LDADHRPVIGPQQEPAVRPLGYVADALADLQRFGQQHPIVA
jgi:hypothetical protein